MPKHRKSELIPGRYFQWRLKSRKGVWHADGRSNAIDAGRHSLGTRDATMARERLQELDLAQAVAHGLAQPAARPVTPSSTLSLEQGRHFYEQHISRPQIVGGTRAKTAQRYKAVLDKFLPFAISQRIHNWNAVDAVLLQQYARHLEHEDYAYRTVYLELNTVKQIVKWLIQEKHLPDRSPIHLPVSKAQGTDTYCWRAEEVRAMVAWCDQQTELEWLKNVIVALACTGLRISELVSLRWSDLDLEAGHLLLTDETAAGRKKTKSRRTTKSGRGRTFPLHPDLQQILRTMPTTKPFVFYGPRGGRLKPDTVRRILIRDVLIPLSDRFPAREEEVGFMDGRLHSFRHFFCSTCANSGVPEQLVMRWLGHQESDMVRHYYHIHDTESHRRMSGLNFLGTEGGSTTRPNP